MRKQTDNIQLQNGESMQKKITKKVQREILKDIRQQVRWIEDAIKIGNHHDIEQLAMQLSGTAEQLEHETYDDYEPISGGNQWKSEN